MMMRSARFVDLAAVIAATACGGLGVGLDYTALDDDDIVFIVQPFEPNGHMEALFDGVVVADDRRCLRLGAPLRDNSTVVWRFGSTLRIDTSGMTVYDAAGTRIGRIGDRMRFGGGHVPMHAGLGFSAAERQALEARCPGTFWIVGEILTP